MLLRSHRQFTGLCEGAEGSHTGHRQYPDKYTETSVLSSDVRKQTLQGLSE